MELRTVLSIAGKPGLFKLVAQNKGGVVVESLLDGKPDKHLGFGQRQFFGRYCDLHL